MPLESYVIGKVIGKGSYGEVCLVKHRKDRKQYVMKKVDLSKASSKERKSAEQEAKLLSQLRHPNIVSYRESFQDEKGFLHIVMNFCEGGDLYTKLKAQSKDGKILEETQVVEWLIQLAMALQYLHERSVLHRDLKTQNIFLTKSNIIKVGDLGIARVLETSSDMATTLIGTPYYMSPELFSNKPYNHKSDVWALGCCLYEMCTLRHAFNAKDMSSLVYKIFKGKFAPLPTHYSSDLCSIVQSMLELEPKKRPSASGLLRHSYIKKQIALFLERTKNRQKQKTSSKGERASSAKSKSSESRTSKSDSGYSGSGLEASVATISAVDCIIEDEKPAKKSPKPLSRNDKGRSSVDSASSSSGSSEKGNTEMDVKKIEEKNSVDSKQKEAIKKQMAEMKKSAGSEKTGSRRAAKQRGVDEDSSVRRSAEDVKAGAVEEKRPLPSAGKLKTPKAESHQLQRPLPQPPKGGAPGVDLPASRSPRARRRYKVTSSSHAARSHYAEEEEEEPEDTSAADSEASCKSVSENTPVSSLSARERQRLKQRQKGDKNAAPTPPSVSVLPSPSEVIAAKVKRSHESYQGATPRQGSAVGDPRRQLPSEGFDTPDGPRPIARQESSASIAESIEDDIDTDSELEESDVWALGCCLYEMCTLRHAFNAKDMSSLVYKILKGKIPPLPTHYSSDLCSIVQSMLELEPKKRPSASGLLRRSYIKKQIALFLEGTKNRQKQKTSSKGERASSATSKSSESRTSKSDSGYSGSGLEASVATISAVDCIIEDEKPAKKSPKPLSRNDKGRSSVDSASSSSGSSEKGNTEMDVKKIEEKNSVDSKQKEAIKKQMAEMKKSAGSEKTGSRRAAKQRGVDEDSSVRRSAEDVKAGAVEEKRPLPSAGKLKTPKAESHQLQRPLPQPPKGGAPGVDLPASRSPRARRRYKVTSSSHAARSHYAEEEEEEPEDTSAADSEASCKSVSENTPVSSLSARERRRLKQRQKGDKNAAPTPPSVSVLPSPSEVIAAKVKRSHESYQGATPRQGSAVGDPRRQLPPEGFDTPDGPRPIARQESSASIAESIEDDIDTDSELEEVSLDEPSAHAPRKPRKESDVTSLISALDTTLKMSDVSVDRESPDGETPLENYEEMAPLDVPYGGSPTTSGRLRDRIDRLRRECIRGIGEDLLQKAFNIIETHQEDYVEEAFVRLMGRENFERYGGPIWQLKFCESFKGN